MRVSGHNKHGREIGEQGKVESGELGERSSLAFAALWGLQKVSMLLADH